MREHILDILQAEVDSVEERVMISALRISIDSLALRYDAAWEWDIVKHYSVDAAPYL